MEFSELELEPHVLDGLNAMGFTKATPIQEQAIPAIMSGKDIIGCAQTGTGKTGAYLLPILNHLAIRKKRGIDTLIIVPTRELAVQIDQQLQGFSYFLDATSAAVYGGGGGDSFTKEKQALTQGADIIVGTPGRLIAHLNLGYAKFDNLEHLVLDEADRMLDMGFFEDLMKIVSYLPEKRQNLLFSATMPPKIRELAKKILQEPDEISIAISKTAKGVTQAAFMAFDKQKIDLIKYLMKDNDVKSAIIFASTKVKVREVTRNLVKLGVKAGEIHSNLDQSERENTLNEFRNRKIHVLVATDIVSRGIDIKGIEMVINYDVPNDPEDYVHRIGRTARADNTGEAITFINAKEQGKFYRIEELLEQEIRKVPLSFFGFEDGPKYTADKRSSRSQNRSPRPKNRGGNRDRHSEKSR